MKHSAAWDHLASQMQQRLRTPDGREHLERKLAVMERQLLGAQPSTSAPADPDKLAKQQRLLQYHAELARCATALVSMSVGCPAYLTCFCSQADVVLEPSQITHTTAMLGM